MYWIVTADGKEYGPFDSATKACVYGFAYLSDKEWTWEYKEKS